MSLPPSSGPSATEPVADTVTHSDDATLVGSMAPSTSVQAHPALELQRGDQVGRYLLLEVLGQGAMGRVFRAYDPDLDRKVALKLLFDRTTTDPSHRDRLLQEAKAMARIDHPNVVTVYDAGVHEDAVFIAMELVDGPALNRWLEDSPPTEQVLDVLLEAGRGLAAAHAAGVVHRDFKPGNVLVAANGRAKVGDFGLAGFEDTEEQDAHASRSLRRAVGTPSYMSPEHVAGAGVDARSDQFSFAVTMYEALYSERPFKGETWPELAAKLLAGDFEPHVASRRGRLDGVIRRAMSTEPEQRYPSMDGLIEAIERIRSRAWRWWAAAGAVGLGIAALALRGDDTDATERCSRGELRVAAWWNDETRDTLDVRSPTFTEHHERQTQERLAGAVDDYAERWSEAFDASCARVGPTARDGTVTERRTAECLENRYDSLRGLVELVVSETVDPGQVDALLGTLPPLEDCGNERWVPYPSDPSEAARAAKLHQSIARIRRLRLSDRSEGLLETALEVETEARDLNEPYLLARALGERARLLSNRGEHEVSEAVLDEALQVALSAGHDRLAADLINSTLLSLSRRPGTMEAAHALVTVARGLLDGGRHDRVLMGNILLNHGRILRTAQAYEEALAIDEEAGRHFAAANDDAGVAKAGVNRVATLASQGKFEEARAQLGEPGEALVRSVGETAPNAFVVRGMQATLLLRTRRPKDALPMAARAHALAKTVYAPGSSTLWNATIIYFGAAHLTGDTELMHTLLDELRAQDPPSPQEELERLILELTELQMLGRWEDVVTRIPKVRKRVADRGSTFQEARVAIIYVRALLLTGRDDELREHLKSPILLAETPDQGSGLANAEIAFVSMMSGLPPPPGTTWSAFSRRPPIPPEMELMLEVVDALEKGEGQVSAMKAARDAYTRIYHSRDVLVQLLDYGLEHAAE